MKYTAIALLLAAIGQVPPAPTPEPPVIVTADITVAAKPGIVGRYVQVTAVTKGDVVLWHAIDPGIEFLPAELAPKDTKTTGVIADVAGEYRILALTAVAGKPAKAEFTLIFKAKPPPPAPPAPPDALVPKLQAACLSDSATPAIKTAQLAVLTGLYEAMAIHATKPGLLTTGDLLGDLKSVAADMIAPGALVGCRKVISAEIVLAIGTDPAAVLDPVLRPKAVEVFTRVAKALAQVK